MTASLRNLLVASVLLAASAWATNPGGGSGSDDCCGSCGECSTSGTATGGTTAGATNSFDWYINVGLARYSKPTTFTNLAQMAYDKDGNLPTFGQMVKRYFPKSPLQQAQIQLKISQTQINAATFHPSCLYLQSEANYTVLRATDVNGVKYITEILTDDAFTVIEPLDYAHPGNGFRVRVWKSNAAPLNLVHDPVFWGSIETPYYNAQPFDSPGVTPLTDVTFKRPAGTTNSNTLIYTQKETTGVSGTRTTTQQIAQTFDTNNRPLTVISSVYQGPDTTGALLSQENLTYSNRGTKAWSYTITRQVLTAPVNAAGTPGTPVLTRSTQEVYQDFSTSSAGGEMGMKRLMSRTEVFNATNGIAITDGSSPQTTTYTYVNQPDNSAIHGRLESVTYPDGSWKYNAYQITTGTTVPIITEYSSWKDIPMSAYTTALKKVTTVNGAMTTVVTSVGGQIISQSQTTLSTGGAVTTVTEQQSDGTAWYTTTTGYFPDTAADQTAGRVCWIENADGTASTYAYGYDNNGNLTTTVSTGAGNRKGITDGTKVYSVLGVGNIPIQQTTTDIVSKLVTESWNTDISYNGTYDGFDIMGRPVKRIFNSDQTDYDIKLYACCGLQYSRERDGSSTTYTRDGLKRVYKEERQASAVSPVVSTFTTVDGLTTTKTRRVGSSNSIFLGSTARTLDGLTVSEIGPSQKSTAEADRPVTRTTTVYSPTGDTVTRTYAYQTADESTSIASYYLDGRIKSVSGTAIAPKDYSYDSYDGGITATTTAFGVVTTTKTDMLGRTFQQVSPATGTTTYSYYPPAGTATESPAGARGKLKTVTDGDNVVTTYGYNNKGERTTTTRTVPTGTDGTTPATQVTSVVNSVVQAGVRIQNVDLGISFLQTRSVNSIITSQSYASCDGLKTGTLSLGRQTATVATYPDTNGVATTTSIAADGTRTVETTTHGLLTEAAKYTKDSTPVLVSSTSYTYDSLQRIATSVDSRTGTTTYSNLTESGRPLTVTNARGDATSYTCDIMGRVTATTLPDNTASHPSVIYTSYYPTGKVKAQWGSQTNPTYREYDLQGRLTILHTFQKLTDAAPPAPDDEGFASRGPATTTWTYGAATGLLMSKSDADGKSTNYTYTNAGRLWTRTWARGVVTTYGYNYGFLTSVTYTGEGSSYTTPNLAYIYDALGRVTQVKRGVEVLVPQTSYTYRDDYFQVDTETQQIDSLNQTITRTYEDGTGGPVPGRPKGYTFSGGSSTWTYDSAGRPSTVTDGTDTFTYGYRYEVIPAVAATTDPVSPAVPAYHHGTIATESSFNSYIPFTLQGPKVNTTLSYESTRDVLYSRENDLSSGGNLSQFTYTVNSIGQRKEVATTGSAFESAPANWSWDYDNLGQVTSAISPNEDNVRNYTYDTIGNRITSTAKTDTTSYFGDSEGTLTGANSLNQYAKITYPGSTTTTISPHHDDDGNMTSGPVPGADGKIPGMHTPTNADLQWDAENRLVKATVGSSVVTYDYDYRSRLTRRIEGEGTTITTVTQYLYDGWNRIAEYNVTTTGSSSTYTRTKTYLWGLDLSGSTQDAGGVGGLLSVVDAGGTNSNYPTYDGNGNVSEYVNKQTGAKVAHFEYDPFGNLTVGSSSNAASFPYRFSTKPQDSVTGLLYYGYRYYDPATGRWPSRDPIGENGGSNLYGYVGNNEIGHIDLLGLEYYTDFEFVGSYGSRFLAIGADDDMSGTTATQVDVKINVTDCVSGQTTTSETVDVDTKSVPASQGQRHKDGAVTNTRDLTYLPLINKGVSSEGNASSFAQSGTRGNATIKVTFFQTAGPAPTGNDPNRPPSNGKLPSNWSVNYANGNYSVDNVESQRTADIWHFVPGQVNESSGAIYSRHDVVIIVEWDNCEGKSSTTITASQSHWTPQDIGNPGSGLQRLPPPDSKGLNRKGRNWGAGASGRSSSGGGILVPSDLDGCPHHKKDEDGTWWNILNGLN